MLRGTPAPPDRTSSCSSPASVFPTRFRSAARRGGTSRSCPTGFPDHPSSAPAPARSEPSAPSPHKNRAPCPTGWLPDPVAGGYVLPLLPELPHRPRGRLPDGHADLQLGEPALHDDEGPVPAGRGHLQVLDRQEALAVG